MNNILAVLAIRKGESENIKLTFDLCNMNGKKDPFHIRLSSKRRDDECGIHGNTGSFRSLYWFHEIHKLSIYQIPFTFIAYAEDVRKEL